jgi:hypothetical protein
MHGPPRSVHINEKTPFCAMQEILSRVSQNRAAVHIAVKRFGFANDGPVDRLSTAVGHDGILQRRYAGKTQARCSAIKAAVQSGERRDTLALTVGLSGCPGKRQLRLIDERKLVVGEPASLEMSSPSDCSFVCAVEAPAWAENRYRNTIVRSRDRSVRNA